MRFLSAALMATALFPTAALAGPFDVPPAQPPAVVPAPATWDGFYVGLAAAATSGDVEAINPAAAADLVDDNLVSLYGGYRMQNGNFVYGGELAIHSVDELTLAGFPFAALDGTLVDARATLGYAFDALLVYGAAGYSMTTFDDNVNTPDNETDVTGYNIGFGAEYQVTSAFSVGVDYTARTMTGDVGNVSGTSLEVNLNTISLRAAFRF